MDIYTIDKRISQHYGSVASKKRLLKQLQPNKIKYTLSAKGIQQGLKQGVVFPTVMELDMLLSHLDIKNTIHCGILLASVTGLRVNELRQVNESILQDLYNGKQVVRVVRKGNKLWTPVYHSDFVNAIKLILTNHTGIVSFNYGPEVYTKTLRYMWLSILHTQPPRLGIHSFRHYIADKYCDTDPLWTQQLLQHSNNNTTKQYRTTPSIEFIQSLNTAANQAFKDVFNIFTTNQ